MKAKQKIIILLIAILILLGLMIVVAHAESAICYYLPAQDANGKKTLFENNCYYFEQICEDLGWESSSEPISEFDQETAQTYDVVYFSSEGTPTGIMTGTTVISWEKVASIQTKLLFIDSCFSGTVFDYSYKSDTVITSAGKTLSWNIYIDNEYVSSFVVMMRCLFGKDYMCPIEDNACKKPTGSLFANPDPELCQFSLVLQKLFFGTQGDPSKITKPVNGAINMSVAYINGKPWR